MWIFWINFSCIINTMCERKNSWWRGWVWMRGVSRVICFGIFKWSPTCCSRKSDVCAFYSRVTCKTIRLSRAYTKFPFFSSLCFVLLFSQLALHHELVRTVTRNCSFQIAIAMGQRKDEQCMIAVCVISQSLPETFKHARRRLYPSFWSCCWRLSWMQMNNKMCDVWN